MAADAPEGGNGYQQVVAVSARKGAPLDAAALWAGEVDLTQLAWTDSQTGRPISAAELPHLAAGEYELREVQAPTGYLPREEGFRFRIQDGTLSVLNDGGTEPEGWYLTGPVDGVYTLHVVDDVLYNFPTVGGSGIYLPMLGGVTLMLLAAVVLFWPRRRNGIR